MYFTELVFTYKSHINVSLKGQVLSIDILKAMLYSELFRIFRKCVFKNLSKIHSLFYRLIIGSSTRDFKSPKEKGT